MYLDTKGLVTIGVGNLLAAESDAYALAFIKRDTGNKATREEIVTEYRHLKAQQPGMVASKYETFTNLTLTDDIIDELLETHVIEFETGLKKEFSRFDSYPEQAQEALLDMAFNLGVEGLIRKFPTLVKNAHECQWEICAQESHRKGIGDTRNQETRQLFLEAAEKDQKLS